MASKQSNLSFSIHSYINIEDFFATGSDIVDIHRRGKNSNVITTKGTMILGYNLSGNICRSDIATGKFMRIIFCKAEIFHFLTRSIGQNRYFGKYPERTAVEMKLSQKLGREFRVLSPNGTWWKETLIGKGKGEQLLYLALKNQKKVVGIGNIISIETLWRSIFRFVL